MSKCENLVKKFSDNSYLLNLYGLILQQCNQVEKSITYFHKSLSAQKDNYAAMNNLANSYKNIFEFEAAENLYKKIRISIGSFMIYKIYKFTTSFITR